MDDSGIAALFGANFFIGIVIAAVVGVLIAKDAEARGMSGLGWGVFSFLLCIVAIPIYLIVRKPRLDDRR